LNRAFTAVEPGNMRPLRPLVSLKENLVMTRKLILGCAAAAVTLVAFAPAGAQQWRWNESG